MMTATTTTLTPCRPLAPAYAPPDDGQSPALRLDRNEGQPCDPGLLEALRSLTAEDLRRYQTPAAVEQAIAAALDIDPASVLVTAGGDDAIDRSCRVMLREGFNAIVPAPTFEMIPRGVERTGADLIEVDWLDGSFPTEAVLDALTPRTRLISIVTPNNPTGFTASADDIDRVCSASREALVLVDLAYSEFADDNLLPTVLANDNVVAVRTFSKAFGLAGLRVGYAIGNPTAINWLRSIGSPYPCAAPSLAVAGRLARAGLCPDPAMLQQVRRERAALTDLFRSAGWRVCDSQANFVLVQADEARDVAAALAERSIAVRTFDDPLIDNCIRITCPGDAEDFAMLRAALQEILNNAEVMP